MSYESERTAGTQVAPIYYMKVKTFISALRGDNGAGAGDQNIFTQNSSFKLNGTNYTIKNTVTGKGYFNLYDLVAVARHAGYDTATIDKALSALQMDLADSTNDYEIDAWNALSAANYLASAGYFKSVTDCLSTKTVSGLSDLVDEINKKNPNAGAYLDTELDPDGVTYTYTLKYTNPIDGKEYPMVINPDEVGLQGDGSIDEAEKNAIIAPISEVFEQQQMLDSTTKDSMDIAAAVRDKLQYVNTANADTGLNLTPDQAAAIKGDTPSTAGLQAYNKANQHTVYDKIAGNFKTFDEKGNAASDVIARAKLTKLQQLAGMVNEENKNTTLRNLDNQTAQLLEQIRKDPELYNSIVSQLRSDAASGTIAGQRAANTRIFP